MAPFQRHTSNTLFSTEHTCVTYLFQKRWPWGFKCPFCLRVQPDVAPAYTVVCRYCRKQTSITAHTLMHGSKKNLVAWMRVASQFCFHDRGVSARELQRLMELSCYQTAWSWLLKIRRGASRAESAPCSGIVLFEVLPLPTSSVTNNKTIDIGMALEMDQDNQDTARVRLLTLDMNSPKEITTAISSLVAQNAVLLLENRRWSDLSNLQASYTLVAPTQQQLAQGNILIEKTSRWLDDLYHGAIDTGYLQIYLDEFCFRHNTASWPDRLAVLDHLLTGLITSVDDTTSTSRSTTRVRVT